VKDELDTEAFNRKLIDALQKILQFGEPAEVPETPDWLQSAT
jgi:hypothetical protein